MEDNREVEGEHMVRTRIILDIVANHTPVESAKVPRARRDELWGVAGVPARYAEPIGQGQN